LLALLGRRPRSFDELAAAGLKGEALAKAMNDLVAADVDVRINNKVVSMQPRKDSPCVQICQGRR
jgi:hypothetical protein